MAFRIVYSAVVICGMAAIPAFAQSTTPAPPEAATKAPTDRDPAPSMMQDVDVRSLTARELRDKPVYGSDEKQIATVEDVTGSPGAARQVVLQTGGVMGVGGREVVLPLDKLQVGPDGRLMLTMTQDQLKLLPTSK
jgi:hypothetical protein